MPPLNPEQQKMFDKASNHPYECRCEACQFWWENVPPEDDEDEHDCGEDACCCEDPF